MHSWVPLAIFALVAWSGQRLLSKIALQTLTTAKFYLLSAAVSLIVYAPYLVARPPAARELLPALGLSCLMAITFWVTTEAIRRGSLGVVSPVTALTPPSLPSPCSASAHVGLPIPASPWRRSASPC
jgi:drug/metabolite transporter (DMT)-like permease